MIRVHGKGQASRSLLTLWQRGCYVVFRRLLPARGCQTQVAGMNQDVLFQLDSFVRLYVIPTLWKLLGAVAIWVFGGWAIRLIGAAFARFMRARHVDETIAHYLNASATVVLKLLTLIAVLGVLGIETTSFAALLAAVGLAVGVAWSGLLANFAAGLFLLSFRPFKVGDAISAAGTVGTVREIGLFMTTIDTSDSVLTFVPNNKLFMDNVQNFSANPTRRVDLTAHIPPSLNLETIVDRLMKIVGEIPNVLDHPAPRVEILAFSATGPVLTVRPFCRKEHYWQVYFDTNRAISQACS
jgi:small conductance mechanosensitive channel